MAWKTFAPISDRSHDRNSRNGRSNITFKKTKQKLAQKQLIFPLRHSSLVVNKKRESKKRLYYRALERGVSSALLLNFSAAAVNPQTEIRTHCNSSVHHNNQLNNQGPAQTSHSCCSLKKTSDKRRELDLATERLRMDHMRICVTWSTCLLRLIFRVILFYLSAWSLS